MDTSPINPALWPVRQALSLQYQQSLPLRADRFLWPSIDAMVQMLPALEQDLFGPSTSGGRSLVCAMPPRQYRRNFFKQLMSRMQSAIDHAQRLDLPGAEDLEIPEGILERYTELIAVAPITPFSHSADRPAAAIALGLNVPDNKPAPHALEGQGVGASTYFARYLYPIPASIRLVGDVVDDLFHGWGGVTVPEESAFVSEGTTGLQTWEASVRLGAHLLANQSKLLPQGSRVLELGAGAGFLAALCAQVLQRAGGGQVLATDVAPNVLTRLAETRRINSLTPDEMRVESFDFWDVMPSRPRWRSELDDPDDEPKVEGPTEGQTLLSTFSPTLVLAADVVFDPSIIPALARSLREALHACSQGTARALIGSTQRNEVTYSQFLAQLQEHGLAFRSVKLDAYPGLSVPAEWVEGHAEGTIDYTCFPTAHVPERDGVVQLLEVTLESK